MIFGVRGRYFFSFLMIALLAIMTVGFYLEDAIGALLEAQIANELHRHALTGRALVEQQKKPLTQENLDPIANLFGQDLALRVTFINSEGAVLGDSQRSGSALINMGSHTGRPEVQAALQTGFGQSKRYSVTLALPMLYVAVPYHDAQGHIGVVRTSMSMENIQEIKRQLHWVMIIAGVLATLIAASMSNVSARWTTRSLRYVVALAQNMAYTTHVSKIEVHPSDEMAGLVGSLNLLAETKNNSLAQLAEQKSRMAAVLQSMGEGVIVLDGHQCITLMNQSVLKLLQLPHPLIGQTLKDVAPLKTFDELGLSTPRAASFSAEFDLDGPSPRRVMAVMTPMQAHPGHVIVLRDVTNIRRLEQVKKDFIANVSHELRTPVSVIQANAQTLLGGASKDKKYSRLLAEAMERNANRLARIISDLLDLSRMEAESFSLTLTPLALQPLVQEVVELLADPLATKEATLETDMPPDFFIKSDEESLRRILINFLDNAIKYTPSQTHILVRVREVHGLFRLEVVDNGPGIEPPHQDRLFERFYRVDAGRTRKMGGTGLGLSIVKHLAENMGETVGMASVEPQGSLFWVTLSPVDAPPDSVGIG